MSRHIFASILIRAGVVVMAVAWVTVVVGWAVGMVPSTAFVVVFCTFSYTAGLAIVVGTALANPLPAQPEDAVHAEPTEEGRLAGRG